MGAQALAFILARCCAGCGEVGFLLCPVCAAQRGSEPDSFLTAGGVRVRAAYRFEGVVAASIRRIKEHGDTALVGYLRGRLDAVIADTHPDALVVPVPTSRRSFLRRGFRLPELLIAACGVSPSRVLSITARARDQRELGRHERAANVHGTLRARTTTEPIPVLIFDDVATTGATIDEAARALTAAGWRVVGAVVLASTPRRSDRILTHRRHAGNRS